ncbi:MAG: outer membrane protein, partial [Bacteroidota bacterium]
MKRFLISTFLLVVLVFINQWNNAVKAQKVIGGDINYAEPLKYKLSGLTVLGTEFTDAQAIKVFSGLEEGKEIMVPGDAITDAVRKLWKQKLFKDIQVKVAEIR